MNLTQRYLFCLSQAKRIIDAYRGFAPAGFDPQNTSGAIIAAGITAAAAVGTAAYQANQQKKAAKKAAAMQAGGAGGAPQLEPYQLPPAPGFIPVNTKTLAGDAIRADTAAYQISDKDFLKRHPGVVQAEKLFENQTLKDQQGESELMPEIQNEFMRAGIGGSLGAFGDSGPVLAAGGSGEASVARNLGLSIAGFQDRNRQNRQQSLSLAEGIFPRRQIGLTGSDIAGLTVANILGENNMNQSNYANQVQAGQFNRQIDAANQNTATEQANLMARTRAESDAARAAATASMVNALVTSGAQAYGAYASRPAAGTAANPMATAYTPTATPTTSLGASNALGRSKFSYL